MTKTAVIAGANGIAGRSVAELLTERSDWRVIALSRQASRLAPIGTEVRLDLRDRAACQDAAPRFAGVTHVFFAARWDDPDLARERDQNLAMLVNLVEAVERSSATLCHVSLVHGTKWYGSSHYAGYSGFKTPASEDDPPHEPRNFYHAQQDYVVARQKDARWTWSAVRPHTICGVSVGYAHNFPLLLAAYAAICKHLGRPFSFPGSQACYDTVGQATDAMMLARCMLWAATTPACANQAFNVINSDYYRWRNLWPEIAAWFGLEPGPVQTLSMVDFMADKEPVWNEIVVRHALRPTPFSDLGAWKFMDGVLRSGNDDMSSTVKMRRFGFNEVIATREMYVALFQRMRDQRLIP
ncbi:MAG: SDR family oxidoreductase [Alphaproteobacteria bacterium]